MPDQKIKVALIGIGHLGKIHLKCIRQSPYCELTGIWDIDKDLEAQVASEEKLTVYSNVMDLLMAVDAVFIVSPTSTHYEWAAKCILLDKHIFIEKPVTATVREANALKQLIKDKKLKIQIGHVERFNPAYLAVKDYFTTPMFIEGHRLAEFKPRGTDVSVIMDLMIHDIDLVASIVRKPIKEIRASGIAVMSPTPDICNARLEFEGGAVANLTASRISLKQMRKLRIFQPDTYISVDLLKKESQVVRISNDAPADHPFSWPIDTNTGTKHIQVDMPMAPSNNAILEEINAFALSIIHDLPVQVSFDEGLLALQIAEEILLSIAAHTTSSSAM
ncbi:MAG: Gfo/Idh/MocA family oxidoreductase [Saprospiraceae bacterium]